MTILFQPAPEGTTHFLRFVSGHVVWCKVEQGENDQLALKEWDSFNKFWVPGIHTVEHYQSAGLMSIDDFPTEPASPAPDNAPAGTTHCYSHGGEASWYRETADNLFVWRDGSWYASIYKTALDLARSCQLGAVSTISEDRRPELTPEDQAVLAAQGLLISRRSGPGIPVDTSGTLEEFSERMREQREKLRAEQPHAASALAAIQSNDPARLEQLVVVAGTGDTTWFERGALPPVGVECEAFAEGVGPEKCKIIAYHKNQVAVQWFEFNDGCLDVLNRPGWSFRPLRKNEDRDALMAVLACYSGALPKTHHRAEVADAILAAGFKRDGGEA